MAHLHVTHIYSFPCRRWFERRLPLSRAFTRRLGYAICPTTGFFPPIQVERLGTSFTDAPKCASLALRFPYSSSPTWRISDFLASSLGPNLAEPLFSR
ncbi:hypothetical protein AVEN_262739-1 [Araneus ventricosus]|uniref:Uncharacterized protein n=1 Tax=Araneus ventricosus TaxID=182803 RepID=A0A4Y2WRF9_ARAVE|nr:hypothetical protein AVEN_262739-1 [Araneus ventricosus]